MLSSQIAPSESSNPIPEWCRFCKDSVTHLEFFPFKPNPHVPAVAAADAGDSTAYFASNSKTLHIAVVFGVWYYDYIVFNINIFPFPWLRFVSTLRWIDLDACCLILEASAMPLNFKALYNCSTRSGLFHTISHISACVSFFYFTHVIKSAKPVFLVLFSSFLGDSYQLQVWLSILPIVFSCSLAAITEASFNFEGFSGAMISNVGFVSRSIYSKRNLQSFQEVNGLNLDRWITIISLLYLFPVSIFVEGSKRVQGSHQAIASIGNVSTLYIWVLISGIFYHLYNQFSYQALNEISPLTFSVGNKMKRVVVVVFSVLVFRTPIRPLRFGRRRRHSLASME